MVEHGTPAEEPATGGGDRRLLRWTLAIVVLTACVSIGLPLLGLRVFHASDLLQAHAPWRTDAPDGFQPTNPLITDTVNAVVPMRAEFRRRALDGDLALWTTYPSGGAPLGTVPDVGNISPLNLPYLVAPLSYAPGASKLLELAVAIGFTFLFLRRVGVSRPPALVGGLVFAFSGFQVVWTNWPQARVGALIPALFWAVECALQRRTIASGLPVSLVLGVMLLEGFPAVAAYGAVAVGVYALVRVVRMRTPSSRQRAGLLAGLAFAAVLGVGISAVQLFPFADRLSHLDLAYREQLTDHLPFRALATLVIPNAFGSPVDRNYVGQWNYVELQSFIGATALVLILAGAVRPARRVGGDVRTYLWTAAGVTLILVYVGGPLLSLVQQTPLFSSSLVGRMRSVFGFFLAGLAALGLEGLARDEGSDEPRAWAAAKRLAVAGAVAFGALAAWRVWRIAERSGLDGYVLRRSILPLAAGAAAIAVIVAGRRLRGAGRRPIVWLAPILVGAECLAFAMPFWPRISHDLFYPRTSTHAFLAANLGPDRFAAEGRTMITGTTTLYGLRSVSAKIFADRTWKEAITTADPQAFRVPTWPFFEATGKVASSRVFDRLGVRYFVAAPLRPVIGLPSPPGPVEGFVSLRAREPVEANLPPGGIRAVVLELSGRYSGTDDRVFVRVQLLDDDGTVLSGGMRRLEPGQLLGAFEVPVVEADADARRPTRARLTLDAHDGTLELVADGGGRPSVSAVLAQPDGLRVAFVGGTVVYERRMALPRIRWAGTARVIPQTPARLAALAGGIPAGTILLDEDAPAGAGGAAAVRILRDGSDEVRVAVGAESTGYLVVADAMQHGWRATVDGREVPIRPADHAGVAVLVAAGSHEVAFTYRPAAWRRGAIVSVASVLVAAVIAVWGRRRRARAVPGDRVGLNQP
jgi:hypothetical protein